MTHGASPRPNQAARENTFAAYHKLKDYLDGELDLPLRDSRP
jgi:hypothetical protein